MPSEAPSISEIIGLLPRNLQLRFESFRSYVKAIVDEEEEILERSIKISNDEFQLIHLAVFLYFLNNFFRTGSNVARNASVAFGFSGFVVGNTYFTRNNPNTNRGKQLANELVTNIANTPLSEFLRNATSMKDLVSTIVRELQNGRPTD